MMEYWNVGYLKNTTELNTTNLKPCAISIIPLFHYSIIPT
jgi:hypothetical protein